MKQLRHVIYHHNTSLPEDDLAMVSTAVLHPLIVELMRDVSTDFVFYSDDQFYCHIYVANPSNDPDTPYDRIDIEYG